MKLQIIILAAFLMAGCAANPLLPYSAIPDTCEGIRMEMETHARRITRVNGAGMARDAAIYAVVPLVAIGVLAPPVGVLAPILGAITIPTGTSRERIRDLAMAEVVRECR